MTKINKLAMAFIKAIISGGINTTTITNTNSRKEQRVRFSPSASGAYDALYIELNVGFPEEWDMVEYPDERGGCLLYRTNGLFTQFVSHSPDARRGAFTLGDITTTCGKTINVEGGWSSRPGVVHKYTGRELLQVSVDGVVCYLNRDVAEQVAGALELSIGPSEYQCEGEQSLAFYKK